MVQVIKTSFVGFTSRRGHSVLNGWPEKVSPWYPWGKYCCRNSFLTLNNNKSKSSKFHVTPSERYVLVVTGPDTTRAQGMSTPQTLCLTRLYSKWNTRRTRFGWVYLWKWSRSSSGPVCGTVDQPSPLSSIPTAARVTPQDLDLKSGSPCLLNRGPHPHPGRMRTKWKGLGLVDPFEWTLARVGGSLCRWRVLGPWDVTEGLVGRR